MEKGKIEISREVFMLIVRARNYLSQNNPWIQDHRQPDRFCRFCGIDQHKPDGAEKYIHEKDCEHIRLKEELTQFVDSIIDADPSI